jgi:hypothetical protein
MLSSMRKPSSSAPKDPASFRAKARQIANARLLLADVQALFKGKELHSAPLAASMKEAERALTGCFIAISAWRKLSQALPKDTPKWLEAQLALAELYIRRGMLCRRNFEELARSRKGPGIWLVRAGEAFENSLIHFEAAATCGLPGINANALKQHMLFAHGEAHDAFTFQLAWMRSGKYLPHPKLEPLLGKRGNIGEYARKAHFHGKERSRLGVELFGGES